MTVLSSVLGVPALLAATSKKSSSSSSELSLILIVALFAIVYFFFLRPRQQRARERNTRGRTFGIGDEVMSVGGIYGRVVGLEDDSVDVEVAPGIVLTFLRRAVNPRPAGSSSGSSAARGGSRPESSSGPYGGSADPALPTSSTEFGASSGHFDDSARTGGPGDEEGEGHSGGDQDDEDDDWDFEDEEGDAGAEPAGPEGEAGEADQDANGGPSTSAPDGSATGTPRTTGGSSSEED